MVVVVVYLIAREILEATCRIISHRPMITFWRLFIPITIIVIHYLPTLYRVPVVS